ncbi:MAG: hypothetical protein ABH872_03080 [Candidatus Omnitrophota bacterium]
MNRKFGIIVVKFIVASLMILSAIFLYQSSKATKMLKSAHLRLKEQSVIISESEQAKESALKDNKSLKITLDELKDQLEALTKDLTTINLEADKISKEKDLLAKENEDLKSKLPLSGSGRGEDFLSPIAKKIKKISAQIDEIIVSERDKNRLNGQLRSLYKQLSSLDYSMSKMIDDDEPLYKKKYEAANSQLKEKMAEIEGLKEAMLSFTKGHKEQKAVIDQVKDENKNFALLLSEKDKKLKSYESLVQGITVEKDYLSNRVEEEESGSKKLEVILGALRTEKEELIKQVDDQGNLFKQYEAQIAELMKKPEELTSEINIYKAQADELSAKIVELSKEKTALSSEKESLSSSMKNMKGELEKLIDELNSKKDTESQIVSLKEQYEKVLSEYKQSNETIEAYEINMAKRADKIVKLQEELDGKNLQIAGLTGKLNKDLKELVGLRENMVRVVIENNKVKDELAYKKRQLDSLREKINDINKINSIFNEYLEGASRAFDSRKTRLEAIADGESAQEAIQEDTKEAEGETKVKSVEVDIESIEISDGSDENTEGNGQQKK